MSLEYKVMGVTYPSQLSVSQAFGVSNTSLYYRLRVLGEDVETALTHLTKGILMEGDRYTGHNVG